MDQLRVLIVIPCLNEAAFIDALVRFLVADCADMDYHLVIADGGSTDGTINIAQGLAREFPRVDYMDNPKKIQSAAVNRVVQLYGDEADILIRLDAHATYPKGYCKTLMSEAQDHGADSVVVTMQAQGHGAVQYTIAIAQNSKIGNGGSAHRGMTAQNGEWVDHGHHALMRIPAFRAVGGYDENFSHNEDAELDIRLTCAGYKIWLTRATFMIYYPRSNYAALFRQYMNYGAGRARTLMKHRLRPKIRQTLPMFVLPAFIMASLGIVYPVFFVPVWMWVITCLSYGVILGIQAGQGINFQIGWAAMVMHAGWSIGFWKVCAQNTIKKIRKDGS